MFTENKNLFSDIYLNIQDYCFFDSVQVSFGELAGWKWMKEKERHPQNCFNLLWLVFVVVTMFPEFYLHVLAKFTYVYLESKCTSTVMKRNGYQNNFKSVVWRWPNWIYGKPIFKNLYCICICVPAKSCTYFCGIAYSRFLYINFSFLHR
jgi:hypothetical protein